MCHCEQHEFRFLAQPFADHPNLVDFIEHARDDGFDELKIAVAWAKRSGLGRVWDAIAEFRDNGGKVLLVVGVSEGGATKEGLELALRAADESYVFHDPKRTFHPKVYLASRGGKRSLLVGSSNLTAGGLSWNYEASMWMDWDAGEGEDVTDSVFAWFETLIAETASCSRLTTELIEKLAMSEDIVLGSESRSRRVQKNKWDTPEDNDSAIVATISGLFKPVLGWTQKTACVEREALTDQISDTKAVCSDVRNIRIRTADRWHANLGRCATSAHRQRATTLDETLGQHCGAAGEVRP